MVSIGFFSNDSLFCRLIQLVTCSTINHAAIGFVKDGKPMWLQASVHGVDIVDRNWLGGLTEEYQILADVENEVELAEKKVGERYAYIALFGFLLMTIFGWFGIKMNNPMPEPSCLFCSELVIEAVKGDIDSFRNIDPASVSPAGLLDIVRKDTKNFKRITQ